MLDFSNEAELRDLARTLCPVATRTAELAIPWLLIGAAARDLILQHARGWPSSRATLDVDVAVQVATWTQFTALKESLVAKDGARAHPHRKQHLSFPAGGEVDIVPFGDIEEDGEIAWPPNSDPRLDFRGLREAFAGSARILLPDDLEVRVPSIESYVCLKLFAWRDRHLDMPRRDSVDLADVLRRADRLFELDALYRLHPAEMEENDFDPARAALQLMGTRLRQTLSPTAREWLATILRDEIDETGRLELLRELGPGPDWLPLLRALLRGLERRSALE